MGVRFLPGAQNDTSRFESAEGRGSEAAALDRKPRRSAKKWLGAGTEKRAVLSRTVWFVPIFWTMEATSEKLSDEDKKWLVSDLKPTLVRVRPKYFSVVQNLSFCLSK